MTDLNIEFADIAEKARAKAHRAIGDVRTIKTGPKTKVTGTVIESRFDRLQKKGNVVRAIFCITMECGTIKKRREFFVTTV